jgi:hypothetical protein
MDLKRTDADRLSRAAIAVDGVKRSDSDGSKTEES